MKIAIVGAGGFGKHYVRYLLGREGDDVRLVGAVEKYPEACVTKDELDAAGVPIYKSLDDFYRHDSADLVVIVTPPYLHCEQSITALSHGAYVLCEKPAAPTVPEVLKMIEAQKKYDRWIAIGYQWSYSENLKKIKRDIISGAYGKPLYFKTVTSWPRTKAYYARGAGWGGRISKDGITVLDSIASNACAHHIQNMLFLLGEEMESTARIASGEVEILRANDIENFDTCAIRFLTDRGVSVSFFGTHASDVEYGPTFELKLERATLHYTQIPGGDNRISITLDDGRTLDCGASPSAADMAKLEECIEAVMHGGRPICDVAGAIEHTRLINRIYEHAEIVDFPSELLTNTTEAVFVDGLFDKLLSAYKENCSLKDAGIEYSKIYKI